MTKFKPEINKIYLLEKRSLFHIMQGSGNIQIDFQNYENWEDKLIFLDKGQYIRFMADNFVVRKIEFEDKAIFYNHEIRVLFNHLVSIGYIDFQACQDCQRFLSDTLFSEHHAHIIDISSKQWFWQNPFQANKEEYHIIFDVKDLIDKEYHNQLSTKALSDLIRQRGYRAHALIRNKIGVTIKWLFNRKRILEGQREVAFSDKSIKEIAYDLGFKDPAYFNRIFKNTTGSSPHAFRHDFPFEKQDPFLEELFDLLHRFHHEHREMEFYAKKMHLSVKTLSKKVREKLQISLGKLIRREIINSAKILLQQGLNIKEVAFTLGFEESNHFSAFFKHQTGQTPSTYKSKKYKN